MYVYGLYTYAQIWSRPPQNPRGINAMHLWTTEKHSDQLKTLSSVHYIWYPYIYTIIIYVHIYIHVYIWLVVYLPPWKIWLRQLGWWNSHEWKNKINVPNHQPYIYIHWITILWFHCLDWRGCLNLHHSVDSPACPRTFAESWASTRIRRSLGHQFVS